MINFRLILRINHKTRKKNAKSEDIIRLLHLKFNTKANILSMINRNGEVYFVDFTSFKYWTIPVLISCNVMKFSPVKCEEIFFGCNNGNVTIINYNNGEIVDVLSGHNDSVTGMACNDDSLLLSSTKHEAILWNMKTNTKLHVLNLKQDASLSFVSFI